VVILPLLVDDKQEEFFSKLFRMSLATRFVGQFGLSRSSSGRDVLPPFKKFLLESEFLLDIW